MAPTYSVESFHINVQAGDAAIHVLLSTDQKKKKIISSVLIDGGKGGGREMHSFVDAFEQIPRLCGIVGKTKLTLDAIVITHWDSDHYEGLHTLLENDAALYMKDNPRRDPTKWWPSFLKKPLLSRFYCPYWDKPGAGYKKPPSYLQPEGDKLNYKCNFFGRTYKGIMKIFGDDEPIVGTDFFNPMYGEQPKWDDAREMGEPGELVSFHKEQKWHKALGSDVPGLYCVAQADRVIGASKATAHAQSQVATVGDGILPSSLGALDNESSTLTNQSSIAAMVIWNNGQLSLYTAGDRDDPNEIPIVDWTKTNGGYSSGSHVTTIKAGHHGAATSTPTKMFQYFNPRNIIISCGADYGHPRWEVILLAYMWQMRNKVLKKPKDFRDFNVPIIPTVFPYWLAKDSYGDFVQLAPNKVSFKAFAEGFAVDYQTTINEWYNDIAKAWKNHKGRKPIAWGTEMLIENPLAQWQDDDMGVEQRKVQFQHISGQVSAVWSKLSCVEASAYPDMAQKGWYFADDEQEEGPRDTSISIIWVTHCYSAERDGSFVIVFYDGTISSRMREQKSNFAPTHLSTPPTAAPVESDSANTTLADPQVQDDDDYGFPLPLPHSTGKFPNSGSIISSGVNENPDDNEDEASEPFWAAKSKPVIPLKRSFPKIDWGSGDYLFSPRVRPAITPDGPRRIAAEECQKDSDFGSFLLRLHTGLMGLEPKEQLTAEVSDVWQVFQDKDELPDWFSTALNAKAQSLRAVRDSTAKLLKMEVILSVLGGKELVFNTMSIPFAFQGIDPGIGGAVRDKSMIVLGLDPRSTGGPKVTTTATALFEELSLGWRPTLELDLELDVEKSNSKRNGVWFIPGQRYLTQWRSVWDIGSQVDRDKITAFMKDFELSIVLNQAQIIAVKRAYWELGEPEYKSSVTFALSVDIKTKTDTATLSAYLKLSEQSTSLIVQCTNGPSLDKIVDWIMGAFESADTAEDKPDGSVVSKILSAIGERIRPREAMIKLDSDKKPAYCSITFEIDLKLGSGASSGKTIASLITFSWTPVMGMKVSGKFCPKSPPLEFEQILRPGYEAYRNILPDAQDAVQSIPVKALFPGDDKKIEDIPSQVNINITQLQLDLSKDEVRFMAVLMSSNSELQQDPDVPHLRLGMLRLEAFFSPTSGSWGMQFDIAITLTGQVKSSKLDTEPPRAMLFGQLKYLKSKQVKDEQGVLKNANIVRYQNQPSAAGSSWEVRARVQDLNVSALWEFFDPDPETRKSLIEMLGNIRIEYLDFLYSYGGSGKSSGFTFDGKLLIDVLALTVNYNYTTADAGKGPKWSFAAKLQFEDGNIIGGQVTVGKILKSLHGDGAGSGITLPDFVNSIDLSGGNVAIDLLVEKIEIEKKKVPALVFKTQLKIGDFEIMYIQYRQKGSTKTKRLFRAALTGLPHVENVPIIEKISQPFDQMYFLYVSDGQGPTGGITKEELDSLKDALVLATSAKNPKDTDILVSNGNHFVVAMNIKGKSTAILDYKFVSNQDTPKQLVRAGDAPQPSDEPTSPGKASLKKTVGPLTLNSIALKYKEGKLGIILDATFKLGPIELDLIGFSIMVALKSLKKIGVDDVSVDINGLTVAYNQPPTSMAGTFIRIDDSMYGGGIAISLAPYVFAAAGNYGTIKTTNEKGEAISFKTVGVFAQIHGPIIELEFAEISGLCGGFGYNSHLQFPTIDQISQFPLVGGNTNAEGKSVMEIFKMFEQKGGWITPRNDSNWIAAGMTITAAQTLSITAVAIVQWDPNVKLNIVANAVGSFPPKGSGRKFVYVELGILATVDFAAGSMMVEGKLAPTSYILDPSCHLSGGFALSYWFGESQHAGDWVFTLGGYHPAFTAPAHYPRVDRLAISWTLDSNLSILGQAYLAITPRTVMAGALIRVALHLGPLAATFNAWLDFLVNFQPFYYQISAGVSVHVTYTQDLWITTLYFEVEIGATLQIMGPATHGTVHVNFWVFGFDIKFGDYTPKPYRLSLQEFYDRVVKQNGDNKKPGDNAHIITCKKGLIPPKEGGASSEQGATWNVRGGGLSFVVKSPFPFTIAVVEGGEGVKDEINSVYARPMKRPESLITTVNIAIYKSEAMKDIVTGFVATEEAAQLPLAVWGKYDRSEDPMENQGQIGSLLDGNKEATVRLMNGVALAAPDAQYADEKIKKFNVFESNLQEVQRRKQEPLAKCTGPWLPAKPDSDKKRQYDLVRSTWMAGASLKEGEKGRATQAANLWAEIMNWKTTEEEKSRVLIGDPPAGLLKKEIFEVDFLAPPLVCRLRGGRLSEAAGGEPRPRQRRRAGDPASNPLLQ